VLGAPTSCASSFAASLPVKAPLLTPSCANVG
jgi:hypothetical protein